MIDCVINFTKFLNGTRIYRINTDFFSFFWIDAYQFKKGNHPFGSNKKRFLLCFFDMNFYGIVWGRYKSQYKSRIGFLDCLLSSVSICVIRVLIMGHGFAGLHGFFWVFLNWWLSIQEKKSSLRDISTEHLAMKWLIVFHLPLLVEVKCRSASGGPRPAGVLLWQIKIT